MFRLISKISAISFVFLSSTISFEMLASDSQKVPNDVLLKIAAHSDGCVKNNLQKTNKFLHKTLSINNSDFLLNLNSFLLFPEERENIWLRAFLNNQENIKNRFEKCINNEINILTFNAMTDTDKNSITRATGLESKISLEIIKIVSPIKDFSCANTIKKEDETFNSFTKLFQIMALCGDKDKIKQCCSYIKNNCHVEFLNINHIPVEFLKINQCLVTRIILEEAMRRGNVEIFEIIATEDPFGVANSTCMLQRLSAHSAVVVSGPGCPYSSILETLQNVKMPEGQQNKKRQCVEIYKKTVTNKEILERCMNDDDDNGCRCKCIIF